MSRRTCARGEFDRKIYVYTYLRLALLSISAELRSDYLRYLEQLGTLLTISISFSISQKIFTVLMGP